MEFEKILDYDRLKGQIIYRSSEYSIDFVPEPDEILNGGVSLSIDTLQIEFSMEDRTLLYPWGLCPHTSWKKEQLTVPASSQGGVRIKDNNLIAYGISNRVGTSDEWRKIYDEDSNWLYITRHNNYDTHLNIEVAKNFIVGLLSTKLVAIWMRLQYV